MEQRLLQCLEGKEDSYILPFLWLHGETHAQLSEELDAIQASGIREFCAESRPYQQFGQPQWWEDFGFLLKEARRRNMRVWLLDDQHFPTGFANGYYRTHERENKFPMLRESHMDVSGPRPQACLLANRFDPATEELHAVIAYRRSGNGIGVCGDPIELTPTLRDGLVTFDVPEGLWRVFFFIRTGMPKEKADYIDMLSVDSCHAMIEAVYEPQYEHFSEYFGNTFAGFFSDEPSFSNASGAYDCKLGKDGMRVPWRDDLEELIAAEAGVSAAEIHALLPALWHEVEGKTPLIRSYYMETVTKLYSKNFCWQLGNWCRAHHVLYIGHVIEDMNTHMRIGYGSGHFFRALDGQDMAGIDVVLHQIIPGIQELPFEVPLAGHTADPEFFTYTLAKLGASHSHIQPLKQGRAMCEIFGAFGWAEGLPMMKQLADHMLVNGINYYVPHAFSPKYPDKDCPPHFYARGNHPQFRQFRLLMDYMQRVSHVLSGGVHKASAAVFYNAEGEWSGGRNMLFQKIAKVLTQHQIDFDFLPADVLSPESVKDGILHINEESYGCLLVSQSDILPEPLLRKFSALAQEGLPVIFADELPVKTSEGRAAAPWTADFETMPLKKIPVELRRRNIYEITVKDICPYLRYYHVSRNGSEIYMFYNEDVHRGIDTFVRLPESGDYVIYDPWQNRAFRSHTTTDGMRLRLSAGESILVCFHGNTETELPEFDWTQPVFRPLHPVYHISVQEVGEGKYRPLCDDNTLASITSLPGLGHFSGFIRYESEFCLTEEETADILDLGTVGETAVLTVNGIVCGERICPPYRFDISKAVHPGRNTFVVEVANNPAYRERDGLSAYLPLPPSGLIGPVMLEIKKK